MEIERFELTQQVAACSGVKVHMLDSNCVKNDMSLPGSMLDLAYAGFFMDGCTLTATILEPHDGICYNTAFNMAFTS